MNKLARAIADLTPEQRALLELRLKKKRAKNASLDKIQPRPDPALFPLSAAQERIWLLNYLNPESTTYNITEAIHLNGKLNLEALEQSLTNILERHQLLRATFPGNEGRPVQQIRPLEPVKIPQLDLQIIPEPRREPEIQRLIRYEAQHPFDLAQGPLLRTKLLKLGTAEHVLLIAMHHIVSDAWSFDIFMGELSCLYEQFATGRPAALSELSLQYADFAHWQQQWLQSPAAERQLDHWTEQLQEHVSALQLPTDRPQQSIQSYQGTHQTFVLPKALTDQLKLLSRQEQSTLFAILLSAFAALLHRYSEQEDLLICSPVVGRKRIETETIIGYFNNIIVLRCDLSGNPTFREAVKRVHQVVLGAYDHQELPFQKVVELPAVRRTPLARALFSLQDGLTQSLELPGLVTTAIPVDGGTADFDLALFMEEQGDLLAGEFQYKTDLFTDRTITRLIDRFQTVLTSLASNPGQSLSALPRFETARSGEIDGPLSNGNDQSPAQVVQPMVMTAVAPRDQLEVQLVQIWEEILDIRPVGVKDNFFALGGHSLLAVQLLARIEQVMGEKLSLNALFQAPTIEQLAQLLRSDSQPVSFTSLVAVQPHGSNPPFFCVPANLGNVFLELEGVVRHLDAKQPFYAFQDGVDNPAQVEALAAQYLAELLIVQPEAPYLLGGICSGAVIAYEMAQQLLSQGRQIALLAMVEPSEPQTASLVGASFELGRFMVSRSLRGFGRHSQQIVSSSTELDSTGRLTYLRLKAKVMANLWAVDRYAPQPYPGFIDLFMGSESIECPDNRQWAWQELALGGTAIHVIPATHDEITGDNQAKMDETALQVFAEQLKDCIDRVMVNISQL